MGVVYFTGNLCSKPSQVLLCLALQSLPFQFSHQWGQSNRGTPESRDHNSKMILLNFVLIALLAASKAVCAVQFLQLPFNDFHHQFMKKFGDAKSFRTMQPLPYFRNVEQTETDCPGAPFLWKIVEIDSGEHVGFGLGTMHLPPDLVLTEEAYASIIHAVEDSCNIYGEVNLLDPQIIAEIQACVAPLEENAATVEDIPDDDVKAAYEEKLMEIAAMTSDDESIVDSLYQALLQLPLYAVEQVIVYSNTPEYEEYLLQTFAGNQPEALDLALLSLGRIAGGVELVSTQCDVLKSLYLAPEELDVSSLLLVLNQTLSNLITSYKCGNIESFEGNGEFEDFLLDDRNEQMAAAVAEILQTSNERVLFAFGNAHWLVGDKSLKILLKGYGYSLEYAPTYGKDDAADLSNEECGVRFDNESGIFELIRANLTNSSVHVTSTPTASSTMAPTVDGSLSPSTRPVSGENSDKPPRNSAWTFQARFYLLSCVFSYVYLSISN
ncbi:hypothetical protein ACHAW6_003416 [Cyclotella cf. meneghiniana]